jgi:hypothetical protein
LELAGEFVIDLVLRGIAKVLVRSTELNPALASLSYVALSYALLGCAAGGLSLLVFPHAIVHRSRIHGISLLIGPLITGWLMSQIGSTLRQQGKKVVQIESFGYGFAFALGVAAIRYFFVS